MNSTTPTAPMTDEAWAKSFLERANLGDSNGWRLALQELTARLAHRSSPSSAWRDIKDAPKDGTTILLHCDWEPITVIGYWGTSPTTEGEQSRECWRVKWDEAAFEDGFEATQWAPLTLPEPPK